MTTAYQSPVGAVFVEPAPLGRIRLSVQQGRTMADLDIDVDKLESVIGHILEAAKATEPPMMDVGPTNDVNLVCRRCGAMVHPKNMDFHQEWHKEPR